MYYIICQRGILFQLIANFLFKTQVLVVFLCKKQVFRTKLFSKQVLNDFEEKNPFKIDKVKIAVTVITVSLSQHYDKDSVGGGTLTTTISYVIYVAEPLLKCTWWKALGV